VAELTLVEVVVDNLVVGEVVVVEMGHLVLVRGEVGANGLMLTTDMDKQVPKQVTQKIILMELMTLTFWIVDIRVVGIPLVLIKAVAVAVLVVMVNRQVQVHPTVRIEVVMVVHPKQMLLEQGLMFIIQQEAQDRVVEVGMPMLTIVALVLLLIIVGMVVLGIHMVADMVEVESL
jgi:hypothetical protein